jgi:hypothetical protein
MDLSCILLKFSLSEKAKKICKIFLMVWTSKCSNLEEDCTNYCALLRKAELYLYRLFRFMGHICKCKQLFSTVRNSFFNKLYFGIWPLRAAMAFIASGVSLKSGCFEGFLFSCSGFFVFSGSGFSKFRRFLRGRFCSGLRVFCRFALSCDWLKQKSE